MKNTKHSSVSGVFQTMKLAAVSILLLTTLLLQAAKVGSVRFDQPGSGSRFPESGLVPMVKLHPGIEYDRRTLDEDVKRLQKTGNFADVVGEAVENKDGLIDVTFKLKMHSRITKLDFSGNEKFATHDLAQELTLNVGDIINDQRLQESANNLRKFYMERGYRDATVTPAVIPDGENGVSLLFKIKENLRLKVNDVNFEGAKLFSRRDLRNSIANQYSYWNLLPFVNDFLNRGLLDRHELNIDRARIVEKYQNEGYLDAKVVSVDTVPVADDPEYVDITFTIDEGEPYTVSAITISGAEKFTPADLDREIVLKSGKTFSLAEEQKSIQNIISLYETLGYCDVNCRAVRTENYLDHTVAIDFVIREGRIYHVRDVIISGNTETKDKVLRRELAIQPGDPVDRNRIDISRRRLAGMGYFTRVEADAINADALDEKDVRITVEEKKERYHLRLGGGVSDINSVFGMAEISCDNFDILNPGNWFYGGGQRMRIQGIFGLDNAGYNIDFVEPWLFDIPLRFELSSYMTFSEYDEYDEWRVGARTSLQHKIFDDFTTISAGYKFEVVRIHNISRKMKSYFKENDLDGYFTVGQLSVSISRDTRDSLTDPTEGYHISLFGSISPRALGTSSDYYRLEAKGSYYISFFDKAIVAMVGAKIGTVSPFNRNNLNDVPIFERYFLGGGDTLRGFDYRSVGPHSCGENVGGQTMLLMTAEISHPIWGPVRGAFFVDAGNAWRNSWSMNIADINIGAGYGLRIKLPNINVPIKLDLAYPVLDNTEDESRKLRLHFNVGFTF